MFQPRHFVNTGLPEMFSASLPTFWSFVFLAIGQVVAQPEGPPARPFNVLLAVHGHGKVFIYWQHQRNDLIYEFRTGKSENSRKFKGMTIFSTEHGPGNILHESIDKHTKHGLLRACKNEVCSSWVFIEGKKTMKYEEIGPHYVQITSQGLPMAPENLRMAEPLGTVRWISWDQPTQLGTPNMIYQYKTVTKVYKQLGRNLIRRKDGVYCVAIKSMANLIVLKACYSEERCSDAIAAFKEKVAPTGLKDCIEKGTPIGTQDPPQVFVVGPTKEQVIAHFKARPDVLRKGVMEELSLETVARLIEMMKAKADKRKRKSNDQGERETRRRRTSDGQGHTGGPAGPPV